jgi:hypothetical protein
MEQLAKKIKEKKVILFVGAGLSATLGLPTWSKLMDYVAEELDIDKDIFSIYGDPLQLAEFYKLDKGTIGPLRSWMDVHWNVKEEQIEKSEIFKNLIELEIPIIYTTNFDRCLEKAYSIYKKDYIKIAKVEDICKCENDKIQIIKFHGDFDDDDSIILTESSYFNRMDFESPLDIKLRADVLGKTILFIGYSLSDINMRYLIYKLNKLWSESNKNLQPESYMFMTSPNPVQEKILMSRKITPIIGEGNNPTYSLQTFLKKLVSLVVK